MNEGSKDPTPSERRPTVEGQLETLRVRAPVPEMLRAPSDTSVILTPESHPDFFHPLQAESLDEVKQWIGMEPSEPVSESPEVFPAFARHDATDWTMDEHLRLASYARDYVWGRRSLSAELVSTLNVWYLGLTVQLLVLFARDVVVERGATLHIPPEAPLLIANKIWVGRGGAIRFEDGLRMQCAVFEREFMP